jgi:rabenosyn-5
LYISYFSIYKLPSSHDLVKMPPRTLGGGRVLGRGKNASPAIPTAYPSTAPKGHILSPAASSASLNSEISSEVQDLTSRISLENGETSISVTANATTQLSCPICNEEMVNAFSLSHPLFFPFDSSVPIPMMLII